MTFTAVFDENPISLMTKLTGRVIRCQKPRGDRVDVLVIWCNSKLIIEGKWLCELYVTEDFTRIIAGYEPYESMPQFVLKE